MHTVSHHSEDIPDAPLAPCGSIEEARRSCCVEDVSGIRCTCECDNAARNTVCDTLMRVVVHISVFWREHPLKEEVKPQNGQTKLIHGRYVGWQGPTRVWEPRASSQKVSS